MCTERFRRDLTIDFDFEQIAGSGCNGCAATCVLTFYNMTIYSSDAK